MQGRIDPFGHVTAQWRNCMARAAAGAADSCAAGRPPAFESTCRSAAAAQPLRGRRHTPSPPRRLALLQQLVPAQPAAHVHAVGRHRAAADGRRRAHAQAAAVWQQGVVLCESACSGGPQVGGRRDMCMCEGGRWFPLCSRPLSCSCTCQRLPPAELQPLAGPVRERTAITTLPPKGWPARGRDPPAPAAPASGSPQLISSRTPPSARRASAVWPPGRRSRRGSWTGAPSGKLSVTLKKGTAVTNDTDSVPASWRAGGVGGGAARGLKQTRQGGGFAPPTGSSTTSLSAATPWW